MTGIIDARKVRMGLVAAQSVPDSGMRTRTSPVIGLLHPGEMGSAVGRCLAARGHTVLWASAGRGPQTAERARACGLHDVGTAAAMAGQADVIFSVCPPHAALDVARSVPGFRGTYVDANAVSPQTARDVAAIVEGGAGYVDGGIIGPPPAAPGSTRLYLSGPAAEPVRSLFDGTALDARLVQGDIGSASSVKMAYAAWTKGSAALLLAVRALADAEGVSERPAGGVGALAARTPGQVARRGRIGGRQGLALDRGNGGDRRDHGRRRAAAGFPPGRGRDLPPVRLDMRAGHGPRAGLSCGQRFDEIATNVSATRRRTFHHLGDQRLSTRLARAIMVR